MRISPLRPDLKPVQRSAPLAFPRIDGEEVPFQNIFCHRFEWIKQNICLHGRILDVGCRDGTVWIAGYHAPTPPPVDRILFFDLDHWVQKWAKNPTFIRGDGFRLPFKDNSIETVTCGDVLEHVPDPPALIRELIRVSKVKVILTTPDEYHWMPDLAPFGEDETTLPDFKERMIKDTIGCKMEEAECRDFVDEMTRRHIWHIQHFSDVSFLETLRLGGAQDVDAIRIWAFWDDFRVASLGANFGAILWKAGFGVVPP